ncbi:MAG: response regulator [Proteobacteria bacterium]|nr:response regulator [Pseudomonadota bacterium]
MKKERILLVDDEAVIRDAVSEILTCDGYLVETASNGEEGLNKLRNSSFDLIITDIRMPIMSGTDLIQNIREQFSMDMPILVITAHGTLDLAIKTMEYGTQGFILKPFTPADILKSINQALNKSRLIKENIKLSTLGPLFEVSESLHQKVHIEEVLETIVKIVGRETQADRISIMLKEDNHLVIVAAKGLDKDFGKGFRLKMGKGPAGKVAERGLPMLLSEGDPQTDLLREELSSALILPLKVKDEILGVLNITKFKGNRPLFSKSDQDLMSVVAGQAASALKNAKLVENLNELFLATVKSLSKAIDTKSPWTAGHSERVTTCAMMIGKAMGLDDKELETLELAGFLHDIGKIGTPESILDKAGKLSEEEYGAMKRHPGAGAEILSDIKELKGVIPAIKYHHERYDGRGYPEGKKGDDIPLFARIMSVADTYDAMASDRPYRKGKSDEEIIDEFQACSGSQFDPHVVGAFIEAKMASINKSG